MDYLIGYSDDIKRQVHLLVSQKKLSGVLLQKYSASHNIRTDKALYDYVFDLKDKFIKNAPNPAKIVFDNDMHALQLALGMHKTISRVQGVKLKSKKEIRIASLFKNLPLEFLRMVVVHELAHLKEQQHNKRFYSLCLVMEPDYHQFEFDFRLYQTHVELVGELDWGLPE